MTALVVSNTPPFGLLTNQAVSELHTVAEALTRLQSAVATASSGYQGTPGTEFEGNENNFGVAASQTPGEQGQAYAYAVGNLANAWNTFWQAASSSIDALDNGVRSP